MPFLASRYDSVFTYSESLLHQVRNARHIVHGGCSIREERRLADKIGGVSMLASTKRATTGHILRHRIANQVKQSNLPVDLLGRGYRTVECVSEALSPFSFSIVIENSRYCGYFTEKLIDCLYCRTIPIYWGDPMVGKVFDTRGIVECNSEEDIINAVKSLSTNLYEKMLPFVEKNFERAINYRKHMLTRAARELQTPCAHLNAA